MALTDPVLKKISARWGMSLCLVLFALTWSIPKTIYPVPYLAWLGDRVENVGVRVTP